MARPGDQLSQEKLCCSICLDLLKDPVTIPCGHSYCMSCIKHHWDKEDQKKVCSCPQCRQTFETRPALNISTMLAGLVEELKKAELDPQPHFEVVPFKKQKFNGAFTTLPENTCPHQFEVFCRTDQQCICYKCAFEQHKDHGTVSAAEEMARKQKELGVIRQNNKERIKNVEKYVKQLQKEVEYINRSADKAVGNCEMMSTELARLTKKNADVKQQIKKQQESEVSRAKKLQKKLQQELAELSRRDAELEQLSHTQDNIQFLRGYLSLSNITTSAIFPVINIHPLQHFDDVTTIVSDAIVKLKDSYGKELNKISGAVSKVYVLLPQDPKFRMDPNTASTKMVLSEENRKATSVQDEQSYPSHPDRFMDRSQVLSSKGLTSGRCYWEVEWSGLGVTVAVAYKGIVRTGEESIFGNNDKSWALECVAKGTDNYINFKHNSKKIHISGPQFSRVGVYVDYKAGILSFYSVSETITLLHKEQTTFTQPLYAGLGVYYKGSTAEFCDVK
ncbi:tripartite motif-containing protein 16-like protein [Sander lucioperca]|uniref:tripartite motif-containing protein 16-like protein n=1 Tax=Sander lucioperca TaxID=283035 RepID=UPI00125D7CF2|nr:tripartite motif-containing protein 16-like protein [Sander lucioperca]